MIAKRHLYVTRDHVFLCFIWNHGICTKPCRAFILMFILKKSMAYVALQIARARALDLVCIFQDRN
jgi:hypothetical protein